MESGGDITVIIYSFPKTKQQQQQIEALAVENRNLSNDIKKLSTKIRTMETEHKTAIDKLSEQLNKIFNYFPHIKELLRWETFLRSIRLSDDMVRRLFNKETVVGSGELYSKEHSKRFKAENAILKLEQGKDKPSNIRFTINGTDIFDWFKQKQKEFFNSLGINPRDNRGMKSCSELTLTLVLDDYRLNRTATHFPGGLSQLEL